MTGVAHSDGKESLADNGCRIIGNPFHPCPAVRAGKRIAAAVSLAGFWKGNASKLVATVITP